MQTYLHLPVAAIMAACVFASLRSSWRTGLAAYERVCAQLEELDQ